MKGEIKVQLYSFQPSYSMRSIYNIFTEYFTVESDIHF